MLLIGSQALIFHHPAISRRPLDIDLIGSFDELGDLTVSLRQATTVESIPLADDKTVLRCGDGRIIEFELAWSDSTARSLLQRPRPHASLMFPFLPLPTDVATPDELLSLKMSHRYLKNSPHFLKTRSDIMLLRSLGAKVFDTSWLRSRENETYVYRHPKLNVRKNEFFTGDGVEYVYDHDDIHRSVAHVPIGGSAVPAYTLYMMDGEEVRCDRNKFFALPQEVRLYGVLEEAQVLALERSQIPFQGKVDPRRSFDIALQKVCTSITSGWFREFAWESFDTVNEMYEPDYVDRFWAAVSDGNVRKL